MEPESSSRCSQESATGLCPEPDESNPHPETSLRKINYIMFPSKSKSS
jgi:hypothetical protein